MTAARVRLAELEAAAASGAGPVSETVCENGSCVFFHVKALEDKGGSPDGTATTAFPAPPGNSGDLIRRLQTTLHDIATSLPLSKGDLSLVLPLMARSAMDVSGADRVSIWTLVEASGESPEHLECIAVEDRAKALSKADMPHLVAPAYSELLSSRSVIESADARSDSRFSELLEGYLIPHGITSTLDAPIHSEDRILGIISMERTSSGPRPWTLIDQAFSASLAEIASLAMETARQIEKSRSIVMQEEDKALILECVEDVVMHVSTDGRILWGNGAAAEAFRFDQSGSSGRGGEALVGAELPDCIGTLLRGMREDGIRGEEIEYPDGRFRFTSVSSMANRGGYVLIAHDTTERRYSARLHDATRRIIESGLTSMDTRTLYSEIHSIISEITTADNFYIAIYDGNSDLLSFPYYVDKYTPPPEPKKPGRGFTEMVLRGGRPLFLSESDIARYISEGQTELIGVLSHWWIGVPLTIEDRIFGVMAVQSYSGGAIDQKMKDALLTLSGAAALVIEKRRTEDSLKSSEARYRALAENAKDGILLITDGRIVYANDYMGEMIGLAASSLRNREFSCLISDSERDMVLDRYASRISGRQVPSIYETLLRKSDGTDVPVELNVSLIFDHGKPGLLAIVRDISDRRRTEDEKRMLDIQIQHSQKLESLGVLAGGIAHDFNNLLMGILGNAGLALMELPPESPVRRTIERLETAALRAAELTNQLLAYSGRGKFIVEPLNINLLIEEMANLLQAAIPKNIVLRLDLAHELDQIEGDATQLRQIVMNLIMNASEAIGDRSGVITLATGMTFVDKAYLSGTFIDEDLPEALYSYIEVSDTGYGMDERVRARIFDPFFTTKFTGRGLGLAAVLGIVRGHKGTVKVYSEPGRGSSFKILLPVIGRNQSDQPLDGEADLIGSGSTVLVVDDEETVRTVARLSLEKCGFQVLSAVDGREGVRVFRENADSIELVLLDMTMPHMNGEEAFGEMRRIKPDVKVILSSGYNEMDAAGRFAGKGLAGFIQKPYRPVDLIARVRAAISPDSALSFE